MKIYKSVLDRLLWDFEEEKTCFPFFHRKSTVRRAIETLSNRGHSAKTNEEHQHMMLQFLSEIEVAQLIAALRSHLEKRKMSDLTLRDNLMVHQLMCDSLLAYELDYPNDHDDYRDVVDAYFTALNKNLNRSNPDLNSPSLTIWLQHVIDNPTIYLGHLWIKQMGNDYRLRALNLSECGCIDLSHDRLLSEVRLAAEKLILDKCEKSKLCHPQNPIKIISFGSGEGLQDFILVLKLFSMGIYNIELTLIEPDYNSLLDAQAKNIQIWQNTWKENDPIPENYYSSNEKYLYNIIRALSLLAKNFSDANLKVSQYHSVQSFIKDIRSDALFDIIYAIDLDSYDADHSQAKIDFHSLADCLSTNGNAILSHHYLIEQFDLEKREDATRLRQIAIAEYKAPEQLKTGAYEYKLLPKDFFKAI